MIDMFEIAEFPPIFNYKEVQLIEIPKIQSDMHVRLIEYLDKAWRYNYMGQYDIALLNCRKIIEELDRILKDKGFSKKKSIDDERDITVTDWIGSLIKVKLGNMSKISLITFGGSVIAQLIVERQ